jgi:hypothetical protein
MWWRCQQYFPLCFGCRHKIYFIWGRPKISPLQRWPYNLSCLFACVRCGLSNLLWQFNLVGIDGLPMDFNFHPLVFRRTMCDWIESHLNNVNTMGFKVFFFCFIVFNSRQLFACLWWELFHRCCKECMGRQPCLFMCYGEQELYWIMDGGRSNYIEETFV